MDSLLAANYGSSEEEEEPQPHKPTIPSKTTSSSSSLFLSLPQPKQPSASQFDKQPKKVVQFRPPIIPLPKPAEDDHDEEDEEEERKRRRKLEPSIQTPSVKSFLSSIPAPKNSATLGVQSSSGSGRRSIIETESPTPAPASNSGGSAIEDNVPVDQNNAGDYEIYQNATDQYGGYGNYNSGTEAEAGAVTATSSYYGNNGDGYGGAYADFGQYGNNWVDGSVPEASGVIESVVKIPGKRGRNEVPMEVIEVKQDELVKNRPREDQAKLTGIAFGPSYQPVSTKGKPSKLHKRKHQIGSLYFDMKQNEMKLAERRSKGMLTKAETQAKYGW